MDTLQTHLQEFDQLRGDLTDAYRYEARHEGGQHAFHVVVSCLVHGDEVGSLPGVNRVLAELRDGSRRFGGQFTVVLGNPEAAAAGRRFVDQDLNRMFGEQLGEAHERRRASELAPILAKADVYLDLHQTIQHTEEPFTIFPWHEQCWKWARVLGAASACVTRPANEGFALGGQVCADEYVRNLGKPGFTLELGQKGFSAEAEALAYLAVCNLLDAAERVATGASDLDAEAARQPELVFWMTAHREPFGSVAHALRDGLVNFAKVSAGEVLSAPGTPKIVAPMAGRVLFPKYTERDADGNALGPLPSEIVRVITEVKEHPSVSW